jgi:hypothetical protein
VKLLESPEDLTYREEEWAPHGLMCAECPHVFREGDSYTECLYAFTEDVPLVQIVCMTCATSASP